MESFSSPLKVLFQFFFQDLIHSYNSTANIAIIINEATVKAVFPAAGAHPLRYGSDAVSK